MQRFYLLLFCCLPLSLLAQDLTGVWVGYIHNDSTNMNLYYELVVSAHKNKLKGYSYTNFVVEGRELTGVKTVDVTPQGEKIYVEDADLIFNDYPFASPKGVKQLTVYNHPEPDVLEGKFMTSRTKQYGKQVTGTIFLQRVRDFEAAKIYDVLKRMNLLANLSFISPKEDVAKTPTVVTPPPPVAVTPSPAATPSPSNKQTMAVITTPPPVAVAAAPPDIRKEVARRKIETIETVYFSSDSLVIEVYDNGYVDGDSVSVLVNGEEFMTHVKLTATATRKTIRLNQDTDSLKVIMFAENLGTIAPNSGMAVIYDGKKQYKIAFSGDLERNAAIILRRKKPSTQ